MYIVHFRSAVLCSRDWGVSGPFFFAASCSDYIEVMANDSADVQFLVSGIVGVGWVARSDGCGYGSGSG